jgi:hypothetical protein
MRLNSTIYEINISDRIIDYKDLWDEIILNINNLNPSSNYLLIPQRRSFAVDRNSLTKINNQSALTHYFGVQCEFYRSSEAKLYIAISGSNFFTDNNAFIALASDEIHIKYPELTKRVKAISKINLKKPLYIVDKFFEGMKGSGMDVVQLPSQEITNIKFGFRNGGGSYKGSFPKTKILLRNALSPPESWELRIVCDKAIYSSCRAALISSMLNLLPKGGIRLKNIQHGSLSDLNAQERILGLLVLGLEDDLNSHDFLEFYSGC